jgi:ferritin-like metal-binding protein YciE
MGTKAHKLLEHGLKDIYDAEQRFVTALGTMIDNAHDRTLADGFRRHRDVTKKQVRRLEEAFEDIGREPTRTECPAARGLVREYEKFVAEEGSGNGNGMLDAFAASAGLKVEHYEIASYRALIDLAEFCEFDRCAHLLKKNLVEEEQAAAELQSTSTSLSAKLAGASTSVVAGRALGSMVDQVREGTLQNVSSVRAVGEHAVDTARRMVRTAERRGRKKVGQAKSSATSAKRSVKRRASSTRKKATSRSRTAASSRPATTRRRTTATRSAAKRTTRRPASRTTARRSSTGRRTTTGRARTTTGRAKTTRRRATAARRSSR